MLLRKFELYINPLAKSSHHQKTLLTKSRFQFEVRVGEYAALAVSLSYQQERVKYVHCTYLSTYEVQCNLDLVTLNLVTTCTSVISVDFSNLVLFLTEET